MEVNRQINAYTNEAKGNLLEYLVCSQILNQSDKRDEFTLSLPQGYYLYLNKLESFLLKYDRDLLEKLPNLARQLIEFFHKNQKLSPIRKVKLCGKNNVHKNKGEQDFVLFHDQNQKTLVSLKLLKKGSFINTKSAGSLTFFKKYFLIEGDEIQNEFNLLVRNSFFEMRDRLYSLEGIKTRDNFISWKASKLPLLPGELQGEQREELFNHYCRISQFMFQALQQYKSESKDSFQLTLMKLAGLENPDLLQLHCYHQQHDYSHAVLLNQDLFSQHISSAKLDFNNKSLISLVGNKMQMQFRIKPMNIFTDLSYKVNCSLRVDSKL